MTLLKTKLYIPPQPPQLVPRQHLIERMNAGLQNGRKLTLISAPAGFGKTSLIAEWGMQIAESKTILQSTFRNPKLCWLSLDEYDDDLSRFLTYFVAALQTAVSDLAQEVTAALQAPQQPAITELLTILLNEIAALETPILLVLDDYHVLEEPAIDKALAFILDHQPPTLHLIIASRADPALPLSRLRGRQQLTELRTADLRFTVEETAVFLQQTFKLSLSPAEIETLEKRTEGWIAGLQMAAISMQGSDDVSGFVAAFSGSNRFVLDYLADEVLAQRPAGTQEFLLKTSILDRFCAPLCDALFASGKTQNPGNNESLATCHSPLVIISQLDTTNLFLVPLDNERHWYRYHHLFAELLQQRCRQRYPTELNNLHKRAAAWFRENSFIDEAFVHFLAAGETAVAADLVKEHYFELFFQGEINVVIRWIAALPKAHLLADKTLCLVQAWLGYFSQNPNKTATFLDQLFAHLANATTNADNDTALFGSGYMLRGWVARRQGEIKAAIDWHEQALAHQAQNNPGRGLNALFLGTLWRDEADFNKAIGYYQEGIQLCLETGNLSAAMSTAYYLAQLYLAQGKLQQAFTYLQNMLTIAKNMGADHLPAITLLYVGLGRIYYALNDLTTAETHLQTALEMVVVFTKSTVSAQIALAWIYFWRGENEAALNEIAKAEQVMQSWDGGLDKAEAEAELVRLWLAMGNETAASARSGQAISQWLVQQTEKTPQYTITQMARVRILLARGRREQAHLLSDRLVETAVAANNNEHLIELLLLQAMTLEKEAAMTPLSRALTLAEPEGYVRLFVDEGRGMMRLLETAVRRNVMPRYARQLLTAFSEFGRRNVDFGMGKKPQSAIRNPNSTLVEPLSKRELEVLGLVAEGLSNREIAQKLYLSIGTVKVHTRNIYGKLAVSSRTQAVAKAQSLDIL